MESARGKGGGVAHALLGLHSTYFNVRFGRRVQAHTIVSAGFSHDYPSLRRSNLENKRDT